jgi:metallo-beta-lactamase class B
VKLFKICLAALALATWVLPAAAADPPADAPLRCLMCERWNVPQEPFLLHGSTYYVGTRELSALLIVGDQGHILLDGALPQSAPLIRKNIESLGLRMTDVKLIVNSHAHFDHAGGIAALQRYSGARVAASPSGAHVLRQGTVGPDDPQYDPGRAIRIAKVADVTEVKDGETLRVGRLAITAHFTPGHTPGAITWSWRSCANEGCIDVVYADSVTPVARDGFRYTGGAGAPDISASFRRSIETIANLPCDLVVSNHPGFTDTLEKMARRTSSGNPFVDSGGCRAYAATALQRLETRFAKERTEAAEK